MRKKVLHISLGVLLLFLGYTNPACAHKEPEKKFSFVQKYEVTTPLNLKVSTSGGNISVSEKEGTTAEVYFIVRSKGKLMEITFEQLKDYADVTISNADGILSIEVKKFLFKNTSVGFDIKVPAKTATTLATSGGNLSLKELTGVQNIRTSGGNIYLLKIEGDVTGKTSGGDIEIDRVNGSLTVNTSGGSIRASNLNKGIKADTSGGDIKLAKVGGDIDVSTSGGNINMIDVFGKINGSTSGGNINATVVGNLQELDLETSGGNVNATIPAGLGLDLSLHGSSVSTTLTDFVGTTKKDKVEGKVRGGGIKVNLSTSGGDIILN